MELAKKYVREDGFESIEQFVSYLIRTYPLTKGFMLTDKEKESFKEMIKEELHKGLSVIEKKLDFKLDSLKYHTWRKSPY